MKSVLTKISDALLIGSILALAYPGHAEAGEQRFIFRLKAAVVTPVVVADKGDGSGEEGAGGTPGGGSGEETGTPSGDGGDQDAGTPSGDDGDTANPPAPERVLTTTYRTGSTLYTVTCPTDWDSDFLTVHRFAITGISDDFEVITPATLSFRKASASAWVPTINSKWHKVVGPQSPSLPATVPWFEAPNGSFSYDPYRSEYGPMCSGPASVSGTLPPLKTLAVGDTLETYILIVALSEDGREVYRFNVDDGK
ncbi:MAG: hypothetical protein J0H34_23825 [Rhizobiales bacterium]|nr:hypothetical protein [Hyphomicrobiales bacterium]